MGWGRGLHLDMEDGNPIKQEGDGRAPAGIFTLGTAFGYGADFAENPSLSYRQSTASDYFVDDPKSSHYNQWVRWPSGGRGENKSQGSKAPWVSAERMRRDDELYEFGVVVAHNMNPPQPGAGSAIFLHVWRGPAKPTAGCTAMEREELVRLLAWLDSSKHPVLLQFPRSIRLEP